LFFERNDDMLAWRSTEQKIKQAATVATLFESDPQRVRPELCEGQSRLQKSVRHARVKEATLHSAALISKQEFIF
jgi:hypothetical protein